MKTVYLLGAGFSKPAGAPLAGELLPSISRLSRDSKVDEILRKILRRTLGTLNKWFVDFGGWDFEQILSVLFSETLSEALLEVPFHQAKELSADLTWAAIYAITQMIGNNPMQELYDSFAGILSPADAVVSLNYDVIVENALERAYGEFDAGIRPMKVLDSLEEFSSYSGVQVLKIHGSSNLLLCSECGKWLVKNWKIAEDVLRPYGDSVSRHLNCIECRGKLAPVIVPPSLEKASALADLKVIWTKAASELRQADRVLIIGCGLRESDFDLRALLKSTLLDREQVPVEVISRSAALRTRYAKLLPNHDVSVLTVGFEGWIGDPVRRQS